MNNIELSVDGQAVIGRVTHRTENEIAVQLVEPYGQLTAAARIPEFAKPYKRFDGDYGDRRAQAMLNELYLVASYAHSNRGVLSAIFDKVLERVEALAERLPDQSIYAEQKQALEQQHNEGQFDDAGFRLRLSNLENAHQEYKRRVREELEHFFESAFPMPVPPDCQEQVLGVISGGQLKAADEYDAAV